MTKLKIWAQVGYYDEGYEDAFIEVYGRIPGQDDVIIKNLSAADIRSALETMLAKALPKAIVYNGSNYEDISNACDECEVVFVFGKSPTNPNEEINPYMLVESECGITWKNFCTYIQREFKKSRWTTSKRYGKNFKWFWNITWTIEDFSAELPWE